MMNTTKTFELAYQTRHGGWELIGDFASEDEAVKAARQWAQGDIVHHDDFGTAVFGISGNSASGHYETRVEVYDDGEFTVQ